MISRTEPIIQRVADTQHMFVFIFNNDIVIFWQSPKKIWGTEEPRNQVPEEGFKSEDGCDEISHILLNFFKI